MAGWGLHARPVQLCYSFLQTHHVLPTSRPSYMLLPLFSTHFSLRHQATFYSSIKFNSHATQSGEPSLIPKRRPSSSVGCTIATLDRSSSLVQVLPTDNQGRCTVVPTKQSPPTSHPQLERMNEAQNETARFRMSISRLNYGLSRLG